MRDDSAFRETYGSILEEIRSALDLVDPVQVTALVGAIAGAEQVFCVGVGRVMLCLKAFSKRSLNIEYMYTFTGNRRDKAVMIFRFDAMDAAQQAVEQEGYRVLDQTDVGRI